MRQSRIQILLALIVITFASACGGGSGDDDTASLAVDGEPTGGDADAPAGETERGLPFPAGSGVIPVAEGEGRGRITQLHFATDRYEELVDFYDDYIENQPGQLTRAEPFDNVVVYQIFHPTGGRSIINVEAFARDDLDDLPIVIDGEQIPVTLVTLVDG
ncbi:MAG: hypothetical protein AAGA90_22120 [Actinomycetota bacterium]